MNVSNHVVGDFQIESDDNIRVLHVVLLLTEVRMEPASVFDGHH